MKGVKALLPALSLFLAACATDTTMSTKVLPGHRPALKTTEAGLWLRMDKFEKRLGLSALVDRDPALNTYLKKIMCDLAPDYCTDLNLFVLKNPYFNAAMAPNGSMHIWTGLLLRVENESQLATVIGHELAHYFNRHSIKKYNSIKATTDFLTFFSIATGGVGFGFIGLAASLGAAGSLQAYSRELETEADVDGLVLIHKAGYDTSSAAKLWQNIKAEKESAKEEKPNVFWASHPPTEMRIENLKKLSIEHEKNTPTLKSALNTDFKKIIHRHWKKWTEELISTRAFDESFVVLEQLQRRGFDTSTIEFYRGEIMRRRSDPGDLEKALERYQNAAQENPGPLKDI